MYLFVLSIAVIIRIFSNSLANVFQKKLAMRVFSPFCVNALTYFVLSAVCIPLILFGGSIELSQSFWINSLIVGLLGALGNGFLIKALEKGELSVLGPINAYKAVAGLVFGVFLLKELPNIAAVSGMVLIIAGSYFVLDTLEEKFSFSLLKNKQIQYRFLALLFSAAEAVFIKKVILASSVLYAFVSWCFFGALFSLVLAKISGIHFSKELSGLKTPYAIRYLLCIVICAGLMQYATNFVFERMNVAYALSLFQLSAIVSVLFGFKIFKEKDIRKKLLGTSIMILGAVLIILYN